MHTVHKKVIAAIITKEDKFLIAQRAHGDCNFGKWEFPGGKMEHGETEAETLKRELKEEFGIDAQIGHYFCSSFFEYKGSPYELCAYFVAGFSGELTLYDHSEIKWVTKEELSNYDMPDPDMPIIKRLQGVKIV